MTRRYDLYQEVFGVLYDIRSVTNYFFTFKKVYEELTANISITTDVNKIQEQRGQFTVLAFLGELRA